MSAPCSAATICDAIKHDLAGANEIECDFLKLIVECAMRSPVAHVQIFRSIIAVDPVDVVNNLSTFKLPTELAFSDNDMLGRVRLCAGLVRRALHDVAERINELALRRWPVDSGEPETRSAPDIASRTNRLVRYPERTGDASQRFSSAETRFHNLFGNADRLGRHALSIPYYADDVREFVCRNWRDRSRARTRRHEMRLSGGM